MNTQYIDYNKEIDCMELNYFDYKKKNISIAANCQNNIRIISNKEKLKIIIKYYNFFFINIILLLIFLINLNN